MAVIARSPPRKSIVALAYELQAAEDRKAKRAKKAPDTAEPVAVKKPAKKGRKK